MQSEVHQRFWRQYLRLLLQLTISFVFFWYLREYRGYAWTLLEQFHPPPNLQPGTITPIVNRIEEVNHNFALQKDLVLKRAKEIQNRLNVDFDQMVCSWPEHFKDLVWSVPGAYESLSEKQFEDFLKGRNLHIFLKNMPSKPWTKYVEAIQRCRVSSEPLTDRRSFF